LQPQTYLIDKQTFNKILIINALLKYKSKPNTMNPCLAEFFGTTLLVLLGNGVVAGVLLKNSKAEGAGWLVISTGWALAVTFAVYLTGNISGAHLNPAVTIAMAAIGKFQWSLVPSYVVAQMLGGFLGAVLVYLHYLPHWAKTDDAGTKLAVFCNAPAERNTVSNFVSEFIATFVLLLGLCALGANTWADGLKPLAVGALIVSIGHSLGGTTGYAINPARDFAPRVAHYLLPIPGKGDSDWNYSWIPVVAPILGGVCGAMFHHLLF
jgi:glycerol uptake facilitator protein